MFRVKVLGYLAVVIAACALLWGAWYAGGSGCRSDVATAQAEHEREMSELRDRLAAEHAAVKVELMKHNVALSGQVKALVEDKQECSYEAGFINYRNSLIR